MSTKKEKWNFENLICKLPHCRCMQQSPCSNHHYSDECFSTHDHSQSESIEWEKQFDENFSGLYEYMALKSFIREAITTAVAKREQEILEEAKKKISSAGGIGGWKHLEDILDEVILKH